MFLEGYSYVTLSQAMVLFVCFSLTFAMLSGLTY